MELSHPPNSNPSPSNSSPQLLLLITIQATNFDANQPYPIYCPDPINPHPQWPGSKPAAGITRTAGGRGENQSTYTGWWRRRRGRGGRRRGRRARGRSPCGEVSKTGGDARELLPAATPRSSPAAAVRRRVRVLSLSLSLARDATRSAVRPVRGMLDSSAVKKKGYCGIPSDPPLLVSSNGPERLGIFDSENIRNPI